MKPKFIDFISLGADISPVRFIDLAEACFNMQHVSTIIVTKYGCILSHRAQKWIFKPG